MVRARFASIIFSVIGILGMTAGNTGCRSAATAAVSPSSVEQADKYQWLEDVTGERSLTWVKMQNARSANVLENDPRFPQLKDAALKVLESPDRLADSKVARGNNLQHMARRGARAWHPAAHQSCRLSDAPAPLANGDRLRRTRQTGQAGVGGERFGLPLPRAISSAWSRSRPEAKMRKPCANLI